MSTYLRASVASISIMDIGDPHDPGASSSVTFVNNDIVGFGFVDSRAAVDVTRDADEAVRYSTRLPTGNMQFSLWVDGDGSRVPITTGTQLTITLKQATGHTNHKFNAFATRVTKPGRYDSAGRAQVFVECVRSNDYDT